MGLGEMIVKSAVKTAIQMAIMTQEQKQAMAELSFAELLAMKVASKTAARVLISDDDD